MPGLFTDSVIDEIRDKCNIVEVVAQYIPLKQAGRNFRALCPFHQEKTPSFTVSPDKGIFHCFGCFPSGSLIKTERGFHKIEDVQAGQLVLTHRGRLMPVIRSLWRPYNGKVVEIYTRKSNLPVTLTADHEVFVIKTKTCQYKSRRNKICQWRCKLNCPTKFFNKYKIEKLSAGQLSINDYLLFPINQKINDVKAIDLDKYYDRKVSNFGPEIKHIPTKIKVDEKFLKLIGYWIAEGSNHRAYIRFSLGGNESRFAKEIEELIKAVFHLKTSIHIRKKSNKTGLEITACNSKLSNIFENLCGKGAENKHIPFELQNLPLKKQEVILNAIFKGDGYTGKVDKCKENRKFKSVTTVSLVLAEQLKDALLRLGISPTLRVEDARVDRKNTRHKTAYSVLWQENIKLHFSDIVQIDNVFYQILPIRKIVKKRFLGDVYNLTVAKDHSYTTPNFVVGNCGAGGNVFNFIMKHEGLEFPQVVRMLAQKANVRLPSASTRGREQKDTPDLFRINDVACSWYQANLKKEKSQPVLEYLKKRLFEAKTVLDFKLGFAPADNGLLNFMRLKGFQEGLLEKAGLILRREGGSYYDRFKQRLIFPIFDSRARVIGFGGRVIDASSPKYMNSPETPVYKKGNHLYGLNFAKEEIKRQDFCIIVEGYVDLLTVYQSGIRNVAASLGTALTPQQIRLLRRYTRNVVMVFDADRAGELASLRSLDLLIEEEMGIKIVGLPREEDPDSFLRKFGKKSFWEKITQGLDLFDYKLNLLTRNYDLNTVEGKVGVASHMLPTIRRVQNAIRRSGYVKRLAQEFSKGEKSLGEEWILAELKKVKKDFEHYAKEGPGQVNVVVNRPAEEMLLRILLEDETAVEEIKRHLAPEDFQDLRIREAMRVVYRLHTRGSSLSAAGLITYLEGEDAAHLISRLSSGACKFVDRGKSLNDCVGRIKKDNLKNRLNKLQREIKLAQSWGHREKLTKLVGKYNQLVKSRGGEG